MICLYMDLFTNFLYKMVDNKIKTSVMDIFTKKYENLQHKT